MAENVHFQLERMLPDLEALERKGLFSKDEIKAIVKRRTDLEYAIHRRISQCADYLRYIEYEINLHRLCKKRRIRLGLVPPQDKKNAKGDAALVRETKAAVKLEEAILKRVEALYSKALKRFPGDLELWNQFFEWSRSVGRNKTLGRSFARAIQVHSTKPTIWIMAAGWEFEDKNNINNARILMQRGLRLNRYSQFFWHEYFKLELMWLEKLRQRRIILFGDDGTPSANPAKPDDLTQVDDDDRLSDNEIGPGDASAPASLSSVDDEDASPNDPVSIPEMDAERGLERSRLEMDPTLAASLSQDTEELVAGERMRSIPAPKADSEGSVETDGDTSKQFEKLTPIQRVLTEVAIPRAIYRNAIREIPNDLAFRLGFLKLYQRFGEKETAMGREELLASLKADFGSNSEAISVIAEVNVFGVETNSPEFPARLKKAVSYYEQGLKNHPSTDLRRRYLSFLATTLSAAVEPHLREYLRICLRRARAAAHSENQSTPSMYLEWAKGETSEAQAAGGAREERGDEEQQSRKRQKRDATERTPSEEAQQFLELGLSRFPTSGELWSARLQFICINSKSDTVETQFNRCLQSLRPRSAMISGNLATSTEATTHPIEDRLQVWTTYLRWMLDASTPGKITPAFIARRFIQSLTPTEVGGSDVHEAPIVSMYLHWSFEQGGIEKVRNTYDHLLGLRQRGVKVLEMFVDFEEKEFEEASGQAGRLKTAAARLRRLYDCCCDTTSKRVDLWMRYIEFEFRKMKDLGKATQLYWRAAKEVTDKTDLSVRYEALKNSL
ncbi:U3 small nucleolar RNA-associated protein 6-domain-containing protein [Zopfochytrium polystomum]|nr:U3 small nucleolar RNA-associated protein 6-domain-containing protein [Zopfochytrium polystomum]